MFSNPAPRVWFLLFYMKHEVRPPRRYNAELEGTTIYYCGLPFLFIGLFQHAGNVATIRGCRLLLGTVVTPSPAHSLNFHRARWVQPSLRPSTVTPAIQSCTVLIVVDVYHGYSMFFFFVPAFLFELTLARVLHVVFLFSVCFLLRPLEDIYTSQFCAG